MYYSSPKIPNSNDSTISQLKYKVHDLESCLASSEQPPSYELVWMNEELVPCASYDLLETTNASFKGELSKKEKRFFSPKCSSLPVLITSLSSLPMVISFVAVEDDILNVAS
jgi:hypothetical protein